MLVEQIKLLAKKYAEEIIANRRHIHQNPELSFTETNTQAFIKTKLNAMGIEAKAIGNTGLVALIEGKTQGKVVALRADMDALPIKEETDIAFKSKNDGIMHACGHDVHSACLLGAAAILHETKEEWNGTVKLIFQPGEEKLPGGASILIKEGIYAKGPGRYRAFMAIKSANTVGFSSRMYFCIPGAMALLRSEFSKA